MCDCLLHFFKAIVREYDRKKGKNMHAAQAEEDALVLEAIEKKIDDKLFRFKHAGGFVRCALVTPTWDSLHLIEYSASGYPHVALRTLSSAVRRCYANGRCA